jgi:hypothetical protein
MYLKVDKAMPVTVEKEREGLWVVVEDQGRDTS